MPARRLRRVAILAAALALVLLAGVALAKSFTLQIAKHASVTNVNTGVIKQEAIVTNSKGFAVYYLTGDSKNNQKCTRANGCWQFWPPVTARKPTKAAGIKGKLATWQHSGKFQVTLGGHPLYTFTGDMQKRVATYDGAQSFGGTWHVVTPAMFKHAANAPVNGGGGGGGGGGW
jgi:predicted lipoprotein with Yx(FWY)xxD motif